MGMPKSQPLSERFKSPARRIVRWYGLHAPDKGKYRIVNFFAPRLAPAASTVVNVKATHGFTMSLDLTEHLQQRAYYLGYHEHMIVETFVDVITPGSCIFDLGANFGQFTLLAAQLSGPQGQVFAFEPEPNAFAALRRNVEANSFPRIICRQAAVSDTAGTAVLYVAPPTFSGTSSLALSAVEPYHDNYALQTVAVERLDDYGDQVTSPVSLIKLDVQGAEFLVLRGAEQLLRDHRPAIIFEADEVVMTAFGYQSRDLGAYLHHLGYALFSVPARPWQRPILLDWRSPLSHDVLALYQPG
jgi:FkbM family methyltransferase